MNTRVFHFGIILALLFLSLSAAAQSSDQNFPTSVSSNEIVGGIKARDIGDSRTTSFYYALGGSQGDIFINVVTKNFVGDIDIFTQDGLRPMTKIVVFDAALTETGRLIYLRKDEKLLLRIQGRTPNDDPASFRIKFGGSFVALAPKKEEAPPVIESERVDSGRVVNSVGTIVEVKPKPVKDLPPSIEKKPEVKEPKKESAVAVKKETEPKPANVSKKPEVVIESSIKAPEKIAAKPKEKPTAGAAAAKENRKHEEKKADPLASIRLVIKMKDGTLIEKPMSEVLKFSVDKGILTVISKSGTISKFSILDVSKVTIE